MAARANLFVKFFPKAMAGELEWKSGGTKIKAFLYNDGMGAIVDQNSLDFVADLFGTESQAGVTEQTIDFSGGDGVTQVDSVIDVSGAILKFDAPDITFPDLTSVVTEEDPASIRFLVLYQWNTSIADSPLIGYVNFGENLDLVAQNLKIQWHADGIINVTFATPLS